MGGHKYSRLYATGVDESSAGEPIGAGPARVRTRRVSRLQVLAIILLAISNISFAGLWLRERQQQDRNADCVRPQLTYSPARDAITYERRRLFRDISTKNPFAGKPRPELDEAWRKIVEPMTVKISDQELAAADLGDETIAFADGSGYIAEMAVYHELHCAKRIRRAFHLDHYYPGMDERERAREAAHIDHCLEYWREAAMCRADVNLGTFFWRRDGPTSRVYTDHECVNWQALDTWARARMVNMSDLTQFDRPADEDLAPVPQFKTGEH